MNISLQEIYANNDRALLLDTARSLFMNYFMDLYKGIQLQDIGIEVPLHSYLTRIFDKTVIALQENNNLRALCAFDDATMIGFITFGPLEHPGSILLRTLPVNLDYKRYERQIREVLIDQIYMLYPMTERIVVLVRHANSVQSSLYLEMGFERCQTVFESSEYIKNTYDMHNYEAYRYISGNKVFSL